MAVLSIESNGLLEKTAVYYNGSQISGIKELFLNIDEEGTFDALIQYEGSDKQLYTKNIFSDNLVNLKIVPPSFTEEEAAALQLFTVESDGELENTIIYINDEAQEGVVNIFLHIKAVKNKSGFLSFLKQSPETYNQDLIFKSEITFRNEDDTLETEEIFL
ncbi:MAG: hypothetical protein KIT33_06705 [Candidatus Kapabacteria bacterium]|nr:hypothetical protein [Ignavibacteriota bacterium]MCW5884645.1 hypothetical protein [Candidatus Kapabacteria bacterium]